MHRTSFPFTVIAAGAVALYVSSTFGCGGTGGGSGFGSSGGSSGGASSSNGGGSSNGSSGSGNSGGGSGSILGDGGGSGGGSGGGGDGGILCPTGLQCNVPCSGGATTSISGVIDDPAGKNPLYNIEVYVPQTALQALPPGVPTGAAACSCSALFPSGAVVAATTGVDGSFKLTNAPVGNMNLVAQVGKWRKVVPITVKSCQDNPQGTISLPSTVATGSMDNMPDIAVSTGEADTLECLMRRIGLPTTEYVAGAGGSGHIHVFSGGDTGGGGGGFGVGRAEQPGMPGAPVSSTSLWDKQGDLMPYDIVMLSCEGGETYNANPQALEAYLNAGGRAFASHFHYAWFSGPISSVGQNTYTAPADWGSHLASWSADQGGDTMGAIGGIIDQTLNTNSSAPFPKGQALYQWLGIVNALGQSPAPAHEVDIYQPRYNALVSSADAPSQPWIIADPSAGVPNSTMYFSFDTPVGGTPSPDGGAPTYCGRAVFSDLHVAGNPSTQDAPGQDVPTNCDDVDLSPQEKVLEFMLFDLSSCVIPDNEPPPDGGVITPIQ